MANILEHYANKCSAIYWVSLVLTHSYFLISGNSKRSKMFKLDIHDYIKQDYIDTQQQIKIFSVSIPHKSLQTDKSILKIAINDI